MKVSIKGGIYATQYYPEGQVFYAFYGFDASDKDSVKICDHVIETDIPDDFDMRPGQVANLEREKKRLQAEFNARVVEINRQINTLLAIENRPITA